MTINTPRVSREGGGEDERLTTHDETATTLERPTDMRRFVQTTLSGEPAEVRCGCGKVCKNLRGLRIHQSRSRCGHNLSQTQRTEQSIMPSSGESLEEPSQESNHSTGSLLAPDSRSDSTWSLGDLEAEETPAEAKRERINWPRIDEEKAWRDLDSDLSSIVQTTMQGGIEKKVNTFTTIIYNVSKERFGTVEPKRARPNPTAGNRRENEIRKCRADMKDLGRRYRNAPEEEKEGITELQGILREKIRRLRTAERTRKAKKERSKRRSQFVRDPFKFTKDLLGGEKSGTLKASKNEVEQHLKEVHND